MGDQADTDQEILEGASVSIVLCEKTYIWKEPGRRENRRMLKAIMALQVKYADMFDAAMAEENKDSVQALDFVDSLLDFFYEFHPDMKADSELLDDQADEKSIAEAFAKVSGMLTRPFAPKTKRKRRMK